MTATDPCRAAAIAHVRERRETYLRILRRLEVENAEVEFSLACIVHYCQQHVGHERGKNGRCLHCNGVLAAEGE